MVLGGFGVGFFASGVAVALDPFTDCESARETCTGATPTSTNAVIAPTATAGARRVRRPLIASGGVPCMWSSPLPFSPCGPSRVRSPVSLKTPQRSRRRRFTSWRRRPTSVAIALVACWREAAVVFFECCSTIRTLPPRPSGTSAGRTRRFVSGGSRACSGRCRGVVFDAGDRACRPAGSRSPCHLVRSRSARAEPS